MLNTYINETYDMAYPLFGDGLLPFPMSILVDMSICLQGEYDTSPVMLASLKISELNLTAVITHGNKLVGEFNVDLTTRSKTATLEPDLGITAKGFMTIGTVPASAYGEYSGPWKLDPSCVHYRSTNARYTSLLINGTYYELGEVLTLDAAGVNHMNSSKIEGGIDTPLVDPAATWSKAAKPALNCITKINGIDLEPSQTGYTLVFASQDQTKVRLNQKQMGSQSVGLITIDGTKEFPNCYKPEEDEAL